MAPDKALSILESIFNLDGKEKCIEIDEFDQFIRFCNEHKIFLSVHDRIKSKYVNLLTPEIKILYDDLISRLNIFYAELIGICKLANQAEVNMILYKGFSLADIIYDSFFERQFGDIDFIISNKDIVKADKVLRDLGYKQYYISQGQKFFIQKPLLKDTDNHEYCIYEKVVGNITVFVELTIYLHRSIRNVSIMEKFITHTKKIDCGNECILVFDNEHIFLTLLENAYSNFDGPLTPFDPKRYIKFKDFLDIYVFLLKKSDDLNWKKIKDYSLQYGLLDLVIYMLNRTYEVFPHVGLEKMLSFLQSDHKTKQFQFIDYCENAKKRMFGNEPVTQEFIKKFKEKIFCSGSSVLQPGPVVYKEFRYSIRLDGNKLLTTLIVTNNDNFDYNNKRFEIEIFNERDNDIVKNMIFIWLENDVIYTSFAVCKDNYLSYKFRYHEDFDKNIDKSINNLNRTGKVDVIDIVYDCATLELGELNQGEKVGVSFTITNRVDEKLYHTGESDKVDFWDIKIIEL